MAKKPSGDTQEPRQRPERAARRPAQSKPTTRITVKPTEGAPTGRDPILEAFRAASPGTDELLANAAKQIREGAVGNSAFRDMAEQMAAAAQTPISEAVREMAKGWEDRAEGLRRIQRDALTVPRSFGPIIANLPSPEVTASMAIEAQTERLVDVSVRTSEQIGQLAQLAEAALEQHVQGVATAVAMHAESKHLRETLAAFSGDARRSGTWMIRLTVAIAVLTAALVVLTYVIVAEALRLWPFAVASSV